MIAVVDTDVLLKLAQYGLLACGLSALHSDLRELGSLGAARFMLKKRLRNAGSTVISDLEHVLEVIQVIEPTSAETAFAAEMEFEAAKHRLDLDAGESILCAVVIHRSLEWLATGDKRAVLALQTLLNKLEQLAPLAGKIVSLEELLLTAFQHIGADKLREKICTSAKVDKTLTICFACSNPNSNEADWKAGLTSYIESLRRQAPSLLAAFPI